MAVIGNSPATTGTTVTAQSFNGDASTVDFTLSRSVNSTVDLEVLVDNVQQSPYDSSYSVSGTTLTFSEAPASGTNNIYVIYRGATIATAQVIPDDGSVSTAKLQDTAITSAKLATGVVEGAMTTQFGRRNLIINGAMQVAQRGTTTISSGDNKYGGPDRFRQQNDSNGAANVSRDTESPEGFGYSLKVDVTTADSSLDAGGYYRIQTRFEGQNLQSLKKGTANAHSLTLSFWVRSPKTGTHIVNLYDSDNARLIAKSYTVSTADTWEYKSITFAGDTTGVLNNDNSTSFWINWWLCAGSNWASGTLPTDWEAYTQANLAVGQVNCLDDATNNFYLTGVQLEVGTVATPFEHRSYGEELSLCRRYYEEFSDTYKGIGQMWSSDGPRVIIQYEEKRTVPTISYSGTFLVDNGASDRMQITSWITDAPSTRRVLLYQAGQSPTIPAGTATQVWNGAVYLDAEL